MEKGVVVNIQVQAEQVELFSRFCLGMSEILNALWSVLVIFILLRAAAFWWRLLPQLMMAHFDVKTGASQRRVEQRQNPQGMELPSEIYSTKYGTRYHVIPNCPKVKESDVLERHMCKVCLRKVNQGASITEFNRDHLGPRRVSRGSPRIRPLRDQVCFWCGSADHFVKNCPRAQSEGYQW